MKNLPHPSLEQLQRDLEYCPIHYYAHLMHALGIIGYNHPGKETSETAMRYYNAMANFLHLNPETRKQLNTRLSDKVR